MMDKDLTEYGYMAGWDDARMALYDAMKKSREENQDGPWPVLLDLWESLGAATRNEKRDAYVREIGG